LINAERRNNGYLKITKKNTNTWFAKNTELSSIKPGGIYEGWNFNSGNYLFTTDTK